MRILAGTLKGRALTVPEGEMTRPTLSRVRQVLFDMLSHGGMLPDWSDVRVLDVFAGSGSIGFEALSRGAMQATFFENDSVARQTIAQNTRQLGLEHVVQLFSEAHSPPPADNAHSLVFLDPPYDAAPQLESCIQKLCAQGWWDTNSLIITQIPVKTPAFATPLRSKTIGVTRLDFYDYAGLSNQTNTG